MKVGFIPKEDLHLFNYKEKTQASNLQRVMLAERDNTLNEMAKMAATIIYPHGFINLLKAEAYTMPNCRIENNRYGTNTGNFDIWIRVIATNGRDYFSEVVSVGVYLSDLLDYHGNREETIERMSIRKYWEVET